jgi:hypothetical protein
MNLSAEALGTGVTRAAVCLPTAAPDLATFLR